MKFISNRNVMVAMMLLVFIFVYGDLITQPFDYHDSFQFALQGYNTNFRCVLEPPLSSLFTGGRPLYALTYCTISKLLKYGPIGIQIIKGLGVLVLYLSAIGFCIILRRSKVPLLPTFLLSALVFTLPGVMQFTYATHSVPITLSFLFAITATLTTLNSLANEEGNVSISILKFIISVLLITISLLIYQTVSDLYLAIVFLVIVWRILIGNSSPLLYIFIISLTAYIFAFALSVTFHYAIDIPLLLRAGFNYDGIFNGGRAVTLSLPNFDNLINMIINRTERAVSFAFYGVTDAYKYYLASVSVLLLLLIKFASFRMFKFVVFIAFAFTAFCILNVPAITVYQKYGDLVYLFRTMVSLQVFLLGLPILIAARLILCKGMVSSSIKLLLIAYGIFSIISSKHVLIDYFIKPNLMDYSIALSGIQKIDSNEDTVCAISRRIGYIKELELYLKIDEYGNVTSNYDFDVIPFLHVVSKLNNLEISQNQILIDPENRDGCDTVIDFTK